MGASSAGACCPVLGGSPTTAPRPVLGRVVVLMDMVRGVGLVRGTVRVVVPPLVVMLATVRLVMVLGAGSVAGGCANWGAARTCRDCTTAQKGCTSANTGKLT